MCTRQCARPVRCVLRRVLEAATWAPSGGNRQPWRLIVVDDDKKKTRLGSLYREQWERFSSAYRKAFERADAKERDRQERMLASADHLARNFHRAPVIVVVCFTPTELAITDAHLDRPSIVGGASVYPAVENLLLACRAEGLGATLTTLLCLCEADVKELLAVPETWYTAAAIPIGYPEGKGHGPVQRRPVGEMVFRNVWGTRWP